MASIVALPYQYVPDPGQSRAIANGQIYVGIAGTLPADIPANQKQLTARQEDGTEVPIAQPVATSAGGMPIDGTGALVQLIVDGSYSILVNDNLGAQKYYSANVTDGVPLTEGTGVIAAPFLADLISLDPTSAKQASVSGRTVAGDGYEGDFNFISGDQSANVTADPLQELWVAPASDVTGASGAWKREQFYNIGATIVYTVGAGGDYSTINQALEKITAKFANYAEFGGDPAAPYIELQLLTGFVMSEQVRIWGVDLSWITITSVDATVTVNRSALVNKVGSRRPVFGADGGKIPRIWAIFDVDTTGTLLNGQDGIYLTNNSSCVISNPFTVSPIGGVINAPARGLHVGANSHAAAPNSDFSFAGDIGVRVSNASSAQLRDSKISGAVIACLAVAGTARVNAFNCDLSGGVAASVLVSGSAIVILSDSNCSGAGTIGLQSIGAVVTATGVDLSGAGTDAIEASAGAVVNADGAIVSTSIAPTGRYGVFSEGAVVSFVGGTCIDSGNIGLHALNGGTILAGSATVTGSGSDNARANRGSKIGAESAVLTGATSNSAFATTGSSINMNGADCTGGAVLCDTGSTINLTTADVTGGTVTASNGSFVTATSLAGTAPTFSPVTTNSFSSSGAIFT